MYSTRRLAHLLVVKRGKGKGEEEKGARGDDPSSMAWCALVSIGINTRALLVVSSCACVPPCSLSRSCILA